MLKFRMLLLLLVLLTACGGGGAESQTAEPTTPPIQIPQGGTLTIRMERDSGAFKPWSPASHEEEQIVGLLYRGLTKLDSSLMPQPDVASSWTNDVTGHTITFTLRSDIRWHDGQALTANDAAWTINTLRAISPTTPLLSDLRNVVNTAFAPTSNTLILQLTQPYAPIIAALSLPILPEHVFGKRTPEQIAATDFWQEPIGSGAFKFEERKPGTAISLVRNNDYPDGVPYLDRVAFVVAPDQQIARDAVATGDLLAAELPWQTVQALQQTQTTTGNLRFAAYPENGFYYVAFNLRANRLFADERVRAALANTLDYAALSEAAGDSATPIISDLLPKLWATPDGQIPTPNLDRANQLLNEAGWILPDGATIRASNGITLSAKLYVRGDDERRIRVAERIANQASQVGINLEVTPADFDSVIRTKLAPPFDFDLALMSWSNSRVRNGAPSFAAYDPDNFALFHSSQIYQGVADGRQGLRNYVAFSDSSFDNLSTAARALYDMQRRRDLYRQTNDIITAKHPYIFLWADQTSVVLASKVKSTQGDIRLDTPNWLDGVQHWYLQP